MDDDRRARVVALVDSDTSNPLSPVVKELLKELDGWEKSDVAGVSAERDRLRIELSGLVIAHESLTANHVALRAEADKHWDLTLKATQKSMAAENKVEGLERQLSGLRAVVEPLRASESGLKEHVAHLVARIKELEEEVQTSTRLIHDLSQSLDDLRPPRTDRKVHD